MDTTSLLALVDTFYAKGFGLAQAEAQLGDGTPPESLRPFQLKLAPRDPDIAAVWLETVEPVPPDEEPFLTGVVLDLDEPAQIQRQPLLERFGPPREVPRLKPHEPRPFQFQVKGTPLEGYLVLSVQPGDEELERQRIQSVILRRFPPGAAPSAAS